MLNNHPFHKGKIGRVAYVIVLYLCYDLKQ